MLKPVLFTTLTLAAIPAALSAEPFSQGHRSLAKIAGVDPAQFSTVDLQRLIEAQRSGDRAKVDHILNTAFAPGEVISVTRIPELPFDQGFADSRATVSRVALTTN